MEMAEFPDLEEPIDEEELEAVLRAASAASSARKQPRLRYATPTRVTAGTQPSSREEALVAAATARSVLRAASAASSARKQPRLRYADEGDSRDPAVVQGGGVGGCSNGAIRRPHGRRLPNWKAAAGPSPSPSRMGTACGSGALEGRASSEGWRVLSPPSCRRVDLKVEYPLMSFGGRIVYGRTVSEVEKATLELLEIIKAKKENLDKISMGLDIEWRPTFRKGEIPSKAAVMQICVDTSHCFVMHIIHSGIPPILKSVLEDSSYVKVGVAVANDALKILKDYCVHVAPLDDLSSFANLKLGGTQKTWSLCSLTEMLTCKQLAKPKRIRMGNWEVHVLSREQLHYAATDAFASWYLYEVLKSFPDASTEVENGNSI